jgi:hypothetical protein
VARAAPVVQAVREGIYCDDGNECTWDGCNAFDGSCESGPVPDGQICDFIGPSYVDGIWQQGICIFAP